MNSIVTNNSKRIQIGNLSIIIAFLILTNGCWHEIEWYHFFAPLGTVITFVALVVATLCYVDIRKLIKDREFYLVVACCVVTLINIFVVKSGIGAFFTSADLVLMLYLADKIVISDKILAGICIYSAIFFYYWTFDVKGYFKGYNTNYGGLVLITGFIYAIIVIVYIREYMKNKGNNKGYIAMLFPLLFMFAWGYNIISWYRARCALLGLIIIAVLMLIPRKILANKYIYRILCLGMTVGAIAVSGIYILLGKIKEVFTIRIFYKDILSGREEVWSELWTEFLKKPLTGIGSAYQIKVEFMEGVFEVHNGLLDILIVHGIIVFVMICYLLVKRLFALDKYIGTNEYKKAAFVGMMAILGVSFAENFFIVPPYIISFMILFAVVRRK